MEINLIKDISIAGRKIPEIISFKLEQKFNAHHCFELKFDPNYLGKADYISLDDSRELVGKTLKASFGYVAGKLQKFAGVITQVEFSQQTNAYGVLLVSGCSPTIFMDSGPSSGSYLNKTLSEIVKLATTAIPVQDFKVAVKPERVKPVEYMIQYAESDFEFLNRLSADYYEWFFYDGEKLNFGKPDRQKEVKVTYGIDIQSLQYGINLAPVKNSRFSYDARYDEMLSSSGSSAAGSSPDMSSAVKAAHSVFGKPFCYPLSIRVDNSTDMKKLTENEEKSNVSQLLKIRGRGDNPQLGIGMIANVMMSIPKAKGFTVENLGKFLITSVSHIIDARGVYQHSFEGVVSTTERLPVKRQPVPVPALQLADVVNNADPLKQGRVKVKFKWPYGNNDPTDWIRVMTPDAGSSSSILENRGFVFVPENGDQVMVGFEEGNITKPVVIGSMFHGKNGVGGQQNNDHKTLTTKSGHMITLDDSAGITLMDKTKLNQLSIDGKNAITVVSDQTITLQTGDLKIVMDKELDKITIQAKNIEILASEDFKLRGDAAGMPVRAGSMEFDEKLLISAQSEVSVSGQSALNLTGESVSMSGTETKIDGATVKINS